MSLGLSIVPALDLQSIPALDLQVWLVFGGVVPAVGALALVSYLSRHRGKPGANAFMLSLVAVSLFCGSYGLSLLVFDPGLRATFEVVTFLSVCCIGPPFLAFGLEYTGRPDLVRTPLFGVVIAVPVLTAVAAATNATHGLLWRGFRLDPIFGAATVRYTVGPWGLFAALFSLATAGIGALLLVGAILNYGPLYRREATAVVLSTLPPSVGGLVWLFELGPVPALNLAPMLMVPHLALDAYAFVGTHMFETNPATRRTAERSALDGLGDPLVVLDTNDDIVDLNDRAASLFGVSPPGDFPIPVERLTGHDLETMRADGEIELSGADGGTYAVSYTPLSDPRGESVGGTVVLYDVTEERQRKQQLAVLNRVLRHNLRNEMTVIRGYADAIGSSTEDPSLADQADAIGEAGGRLLSIGEKVREFDRIQERDRQWRAVAVRELLEDVERELREEHPDAAVDCGIDPSTLEVVTDRELLELALSNLLRNAVEHADTPDPSIEVRVRGSDSGDDRVVFEIRDRNRRIPEIETASLEAGAETQLRHGQGIGLWIVTWCVTALDGDVGFEYDGGNVVTVCLPPDRPV